MPCRCAPLLIAALLTALFFPDLAQAKRFKRYPDDLKAKQASQPRLNTGATMEPFQPGTTIKDKEQVKDFAPTAPGAGEFEDPPGLLGHALHGQNGLTIEYIYTGDVFNNMRGGIRTRNATTYLGLFDLAITADLDEMGFRPGGTFFMLTQDFHGTSLGPFVGDNQGVDNIDAGRSNMQVTEFWWEKSLLDGLITVRLGKQDANAEFAVVDLAGDFIHASFGMHPNIPMPAWPDPAMGVVTLFQLTENTSLNIGLFDGAADGRSWGFSGTGDLFTMGELRTEYSLGRYQGEFHVGIWYHNGEFENPGNPNVTYLSDHGIHMGFDQLIFAESYDEDIDEGLGIFGQYGWTPGDRNEVQNYIGGGLVYKGLLQSRNDDLFGVGVAHAIFSDYMNTTEPAETSIEVFYKIQYSPYVVIQPDFQFICSPSGEFRDAFVGGVRFEVVL